MTDLQWNNLGIECCTIVGKERNISDILCSNYGKSNSITKRFNFYDVLIQLKGQLDTIVCHSYPMHIHDIIIDNEKINIIQIFYMTIQITSIIHNLNIMDYIFKCV